MVIFKKENGKMQESLQLGTRIRYARKKWSFLAGQNFFVHLFVFFFFLPEPQDGHLRHVSGLALTLQHQSVSQFLEILGFMGDSEL